MPMTTIFKMAELSCESQKLSTSSVDKEEWDDFNGFQQGDMLTCPVSDMDDVLPKNCANRQSLKAATDYSPSSQKTAERTISDLNDILQRCFCRSAGNVDTCVSHLAMPVLSMSQEKTLGSNQYVLRFSYFVFVSDLSVDLIRSSRLAI